ncbi:MAG: NUDIX hydrolase [Gammaproteobacteria bacterium]
MNFPTAGVGAVVFLHNKVLLVKRGTPPYRHEWAIPGGKIRPGETLQAAAEREVLEETGICIQAGEAIFAFDLIERDNAGDILFHYVIVDLIGIYRAGEIQASSDASAAGWFSQAELATLPLNRATTSLLQRFTDFRHQARRIQDEWLAKTGD